MYFGTGWTTSWQIDLVTNTFVNPIGLYKGLLHLLFFPSQSDCKYHQNGFLLCVYLAKSLALIHFYFISYSFFLFVHVVVCGRIQWGNTHTKSKLCSPIISLQNKREKCKKKKKKDWETQLQNALSSTRPQDWTELRRSKVQTSPFSSSPSPFEPTHRPLAPRTTCTGE